MVKNLPAMQKVQETRVRSLGGDDALEEGMATHSSILAWRIPWIEELGGTWGPTELDTTEATEWASLIAQLVKNLPAMQETLVRFLGQEDPLEKG